MNWLPTGGRLNQIFDVVQQAQQVRQVVQQAHQVYNNVQQLRQVNGNIDEQAIQQGQNELQFADLTDQNQNLFDGFSRKFLKRLMDNEPDGPAHLLEERRADRDGCTPLLCAIKRNDLDAALQLLAYGANPHSTDANGDTPLHHAIMASSTRMVKLLLCFGADPDKPNKAGQSANNLRIKKPEVADILSRVRAWNHYGVIASKSARSDDIATRIILEHQKRAVNHQCSKSREQKDKALRLLALDGGGIRGLVLIQILMELEQLVDQKSGLQQQQQKKCQMGNFVQRHFDWIAGTSTGAILALALADGTTLIDCLRLYLRLKDDIFGPEAKVSRFAPGYKAECIEQFLREQFGERRKMSELKCGKMKVFVTATNAGQIPLELLLFRNYRSPFTASQHAPDKVVVWRAARCSSAAPTFFPSMDGLMDGGLMANNPGLPLLKEVYQHNKAIELSTARFSDESPREIAFLLSIGTGKTPKVKVECTDLVLEPAMAAVTQTLNALSNLKSMLVEQLATSDGEVVEVARMHCHSQQVPYFRLTPQLETEIPLDVIDNAQLVDMMWQAKVHVREHCADDVHTLSQMLREFDKK